MSLYLLRASGRWGTSETFNFGMHVTSSAATAQVATTWSQALTEAWSGSGTPAGTLAALYPTTTSIETATASLLTEATGKQTTRVDVDVTLPGTSTDGSLPPQCAIVVSLRTDIANRTGRGRFYLPATATNAVADGKLATAIQQNIVNAWTRAFSALDSGGITPVIYSRTTHTTITITSFNVGDIYDTQRRRRNQLVENRIAGTV